MFWSVVLWLPVKVMKHYLNPNPVEAMLKDWADGANRAAEEYAREHNLI